MRGALERVGVPAVINGAGSVFATPAARDWLRLLEAIERPTSDARARSAALTPFLGWTAEQVATADERELGGGARAAAPLGRPAPPARRGGAVRADLGARGPARAGCSARSTASAS